MTTSTTTAARMTVPEILKELEPYTGRFPKRAMKEAIEQREAITPELLRVLDEVAANPQSFAQRDDYMLHMFAMFLLAQFRETRAYRPLVTIFSAPGDIPDQLAGDTVTEGLKQILGSVYDGDPGPLHGLVTNATVDEYVRGAALDTFLVLFASGQMSREDVVAYYRSLFHGGLERTFSHAWNGLVSAVADLHVPELLEEIRQAYADDLVDPTFAGLGEIERDLLGAGRPLRQCHVITDAIAEMEWWHCFHPEESVTKKMPRPTLPPAPATTSSAPVRRIKVGRNDACPCGSGKKYKRCCGNN